MTDFYCLFFNYSFYFNAFTLLGHLKTIHSLLKILPYPLHVACKVVITLLPPTIRGILIKKALSRLFEY